MDNATVVPLPRTIHQVDTCFYDGDNTFGPSMPYNCRSFDFTLLFEQAFLSLFPSLCLILLSPVRIIRVFSSDSKTSPTPLHAVKLLFTCSYAFSQFSLVILWASLSSKRTIVAIPAGVFSLVASMCICILSDLEHKKSIRPSSLLNLYLFLTVFFDAVQLRTLWMIAGLSRIAILFSISLGLKLVLLVLEALEKGSFLSSPYQFYTKIPESLSNIYNRSVFWWLNHLFLLGFRNVLSIDHLYELDTDLQSGKLTSKIQKRWKEANKSRKNALARSLLLTLRWPILAPILPRLALIGFKYSQPFLLNRLFSFLKSVANGDHNDGYGLIGATAIIYIGLAICNGRYKHVVYRSITMIRGALVSLIYSNSLCAGMTTIAEGQAKPITLMSTDVDGICNLFDRLHELWACPLEVVIGTYLLARQVGVGCIIPIFLAISSVATNTFWVGKQMGPKRKIWNQAIEQRIAITSSALYDIKSVKMLGITDRLLSLIQNQRVRELKKMGGFRWFTIYMNLVASITSTFSTPFLLMIYSLIRGGSTINAAAAYNIMALLDLMTGPLASLLASIPSLMSSVACFSRIQQYLLSDTVSDDRFLGQSSNRVGLSDDNVELQTMAHTRQENDSIAIILQDWSLGYSGNNAVVQNIITQIPSGAITMLVGPVGSGKTSFLLGLLGEIRSINGSARMESNDIGYCQQSAWLTNDSVKNIITGHIPAVGDPTWYDSIVKACCLDIDIAQFPDGHETLIGSRGLILSGGQRQRVALARAIYARRPILLLDDVFSALDAKTEQSVFDRLFSTENGLLRKLGITVVLATHAVAHLHAADHIIALGKDGILVEEGSFKELVQHKGYIHSLELGAKSRPEENSGKDQNTPQIPAEKFSMPPKKLASDARRVGDFSVYKYYFQRLGWRPVGFLLLTQFLQSACYRFPQAWVQIWANSNGRNNGLYISFLFVFACGKWLANLTGSSYFWAKMVPRAGRKLHSILLATIMQAPLSYHSSTDSGITLNRFSQDMTIVDSNLPMATLPMIMMIFVNLWSFGYIIYGAYYLAAFLPLLIGILYAIQKIYLRTSRQIRFLDLEMKSPLFTHFSETFEGLVTIRAFGWQQNFQNSLLHKLDFSQRPFYMMYCIQRWLNFSLDMFVAVIAVLLVTFATQFRQHTSSAAVSIALLNIISLSSALSAIIAIWTSLETSIGAIARIKQLESDVEPEEDGQDQLSPPKNWPVSGSIDIINTSAAYNETSPLILHDINLSIRPGEKIGICGRTGSGKSSLVSILFRLLPTTKNSRGTVSIDGLNISRISRKLLRSSIIAIPQEPLLFSGDVRFNAAPNSAPYPNQEVVISSRNSDVVVDDEAIISALSLVQLWDIVSERGGLSASISTLGLSHGQKQLFCLARAIIRKQSSKILILDEATSSVDKHTDAIVRRVIREEFRDHTVISIAHRLSSLVDCDRIVVMDAGRIVEVGSVEVLMERDGGRWRELWDAQV